MEEKKITPISRLGSMLLDHFAMTLIMSIFIFPIMIMQFANGFGDKTTMMPYKFSSDIKIVFSDKFSRTAFK